MTFAPQTYRDGSGNVMYKALAHPLAASAIATLRHQLQALPILHVYDPENQFATCDAFLQLSDLPTTRRYCTDVRHRQSGLESIAAYQGGPLLILDFDYPHLDHLKSLTSEQQVFDLAALKLPPSWLSQPDHYLSPLNFVYDFALFRFQQPSAGTLTRITTANYWARYGAAEVSLRCLLFDRQGQALAEWTHGFSGADELVQICSETVARDHGLGSFSGQMFMHAVGAAGHDVMKYVCDQIDDCGSLTTTHDANIWPAARYGGIPLPTGEDQSVELWIQNPHQRTIAAGSITLSVADGTSVALDQDVPPLATHCWSLPALGKAAQATLNSARQIPRPRYEVQRRKKRHLAHANVVRDDLGNDTDYWRHGAPLGRGYLLAAPLLPADEYRCKVLITPMSSLPDGALVKLNTFALDGTPLSGSSLPDAVAGERSWHTIDAQQAGHVQLSYDAERQGPVDGWLHAIFRYQHLDSGHESETSFGSHMFNMLATYRGEPQSYNGRPPGLRTRLFGRPALNGSRGFFSLIYLCSDRWHAQSDTQVTLLDGQGKVLQRCRLAITQSGSTQFFLDELFDSALLDSPHQLIVQDTTCRLFGYHAMISGEGNHTRFSIDHLFGF